MPIIEAGILTTAATWLAKGILEEGRKSFVESLKTSEREKALRSCSLAALEALVAEGCPEEAGEELRQHLEGALGEFAKDEDVQHILGEALRRGRLPEEELDELESRFREIHAPEETLPGFQVRLGVAAFVNAFVAQAEKEESFHGVIQTKELRAQTGYLEQILEELRALRREGKEAREAEKARQRKQRRRADALREGYLSHLFEKLRPLDLSGVDPALKEERKANLDLDSVYTALLTTMQAQDRPGTWTMDHELSRGARQRPEAVSALAQVDRHKRLALLGNPGGGKSTFVNFLALCMAGELLGRDDANLRLLTAPLPDDEGDDLAEPQPWSHGALLPVCVVLREFAAKGLPPKGEEATAQHLREFIRSNLAQGTFGDFADDLEHELRAQGGLILLDGLDEVPAAEDRRTQLRDVVEDFARAFPKCRILVTSRIYAYQKQEWHLRDFEQATLAPFSPGQIRRFVDRWYRGVAKWRDLSVQEARGRGALLERAIFGSPSLSSLARQPLLLTLMASLHSWGEGRLPEEREQLYAEVVELLLDRWERKLVAHTRSGETEVRQESFREVLKVGQRKLRTALEELAFEAHAGQGDLEDTANLHEDDVAGALLRVSQDPDIKPARLVEYLRDRAGLLVHRGVGVYAFPHRTFQEYLAACHLTSDEFPEKVARLARDDPNRWREVALLAGAKAARGTPWSAWQLARELSHRNPDDPKAEEADHWGALLAGQLLAESVDVSKASAGNSGQLTALRRSLVALLASSVLPAVERAAAGRALARLGDPREEVLAVDAMELCRVPAGPFVMGSPEEDEKAEDDERPAHELDIPYEYWIGRYPVTQAQFGQFAEAGGYGEERFWAEARGHGAWEDGRIRTFLDDEPRSEPADFGDPWSLPNHPVVGVAWYEALAFCRWLTGRWRKEGRIAEDWEVRLPSEAEWEKAARGGLKVPKSSEPRCVDREIIGSEDERTESTENEAPRRSYPWVGSFSSEAANTVGNGIGSTTAAGCFPGGASPYGCQEMAGNVWEWTQSLWGEDPSKPFFDYPYKPGDGREELNAPDKVLRVLRGGGFVVGARLARCSARSRDLPGFRDGDFGFRLLLSPFSSDL